MAPPPVPSLASGAACAQALPGPPCPLGSAAAAGPPSAESTATDSRDSPVHSHGSLDLLLPVAIRCVRVLEQSVESQQSQLNLLMPLQRDLLAAYAELRLAAAGGAGPEGADLAAVGAARGALEARLTQALPQLEAHLRALEECGRQAAAAAEDVGLREAHEALAADLETPVDSWAEPASGRGDRHAALAAEVAQLAGQLGALERCVEDNDGRVNEVQDALLRVRMGAAVDQDEARRGPCPTEAQRRPAPPALGGELEALLEGLRETLLEETASVDRRLVALERRVERSLGVPSGQTPRTPPGGQAPARRPDRPPARQLAPSAARPRGVDFDDEEMLVPLEPPLPRPLWSPPAASARGGATVAAPPGRRGRP